MAEFNFESEKIKLSEHIGNAGIRNINYLRKIMLTVIIQAISFYHFENN